MTDLARLEGQVIRLSADMKRLQAELADLRAVKAEVGELRAKSAWPAENTEVRNLRALKEQTFSERAKAAEEKAELAEFRLAKTKKTTKWWASGGAAILFALAKLIEALATGKIHFGP